MIVIGCLLAAGSAALHAASVDSTTSASFEATADAYVDSTAPDTNYGAVPELRTANFPVDQRSFLRFHPSGITGTVRQASLRLYADWTNPVGVAVRAVLDPTWTEGTVTYNSSPPTGPVVVNSPPTTQGSWVDIDVTQLVTGDGDVSLALTRSQATNSTDGHHYPKNVFASRESGSSAPQLVVVSDAPTTTTTTTTTTTMVPTTTTAPTTTTVPTTTTTVPTGGPCGVAAQAPARYDHVVIVMYENKNLAGVIGNGAAPYATALAKTCGYATQYADAGQFNSLPNYIALTSGLDNTPIQADCVPSATCSTTADDLFRQVRDAGGTAISYQESMGPNCRLDNFDLYRPKHNPATYYVGGADRAACNSDDVDYAAFDPDHLPTLAFITPNLVNDTHDGTVAQGDAWAQTNVEAILNGADYRAGRTAVLWLWDENTFMPNVIVAPSVTPGTVTTTRLNHYGALRAVEEMLGLPLLGNAATATSLRGAFGF